MPQDGIYVLSSLAIFPSSRYIRPRRPAAKAVRSRVGIVSVVFVMIYAALGFVEVQHALGSKFCMRCGDRALLRVTTGTTKVPRAS